MHDNLIASWDSFLLPLLFRSISSWPRHMHIFWTRTPYNILATRNFHLVFNGNKPRYSLDTWCIWSQNIFDSHIPTGQIMTTPSELPWPPCALNTSVILLGISATRCTWRIVLSSCVRFDGRGSSCKNDSSYLVPQMLNYIAIWWLQRAPKQGSFELLNPHLQNTSIVLFEVATTAGILPSTW